MDEPRALREGLRGVDQVYHLAGLTRARAAREFFRVNGEGTRHLVHACLDAPGGPRRLVHLSSLAAVGPMPTATAFAEDVAPRPVSPYGWSKLQAEATVLAVRDRLHVTVLRPARRLRSPRPRRPGDRPVGGPGPSADAGRSVTDAQPLLRSGSGDGAAHRGRGPEPVRRGLPRGRRRRLHVGAVRRRPGRGPGRPPHPVARSPCRFSSPSPPARTPGRGLTGRPAYFSRGKVREAAGHWRLRHAARRDGSLASSRASGCRKGAAATVKWYRDAGWLQ